MGVDLDIYDDIVLHGEELTQELRMKANDWIESHCDDEAYNWNFDFYNDCIIIKLLKRSKGSPIEYMEGLVSFFKLCAEYSFHVQTSIPYMVSWGDCESGAIYISSAEKIIKIIGIDNFGNMNQNEIKWD